MCKNSYEESLGNAKCQINIRRGWAHNLEWNKILLMYSSIEEEYFYIFVRNMSIYVSLCKGRGTHTWEIYQTSDTTPTLETVVPTSLMKTRYFTNCPRGGQGFISRTFVMQIIEQLAFEGHLKIKPFIFAS
jgi:hypothetical protein